MKTRLLDGKKAVAAPQSKDDWDRLMAKAIERATATSSRLQGGLQQALAAGKSEQVLRRLGILSMADLEREIPKPDSGGRK